MWLKNLITRLDHKPVVILHGNVRDRYIDGDGDVYENLTALLTDVASQLSVSFNDLVFYDPLDGERTRELAAPPARPSAASSAPVDDAEVSGTDPVQERSSDLLKAARVVASWDRALRQRSRSKLIVLYYLDKLVSEKDVYSDPERVVLLRLEKLIENIEPNHRLILVALEDSMVPRELYTNSPKATVVAIPKPDRNERLVYLEQRIGSEHPHRELVADITDGLYLRDVYAIAESIRSEYPEPSRASAAELVSLVNNYRIGEKVDYWGRLGITKLEDALRWFTMEGKVKGQDEAVTKVVNMLCLARAGLSGIGSGRPAKPKGVLFFAGPTGVGKTFLAKNLAKFLFNTDEAFIRFDMSEYKEPHTVSKLLGSPPGYVGSEQGGLLANGVRDRPFSVVLFDEIEKAHTQILDIFLQILDDGRVTDSRGQTVFFTETVIIFTSNIGTRTVDSRGLATDERERLNAILNDQGTDEEERRRRAREHFEQSVRMFFTSELSRPELLNRIGSNIAAFNHIWSGDVQREMVESRLATIKSELEAARRSSGYTFEFEPSVVDLLVSQYGQMMAAFGGRGIGDAIDGEVLVPLSQRLLAAEYREERGTHFAVGVEGGSVAVRPTRRAQ